MSKRLLNHPPPTCADSIFSFSMAPALRWSALETRDRSCLSDATSSATRNIAFDDMRAICSRTHFWFFTYFLGKVKNNRTVTMAMSCFTLWPVSTTSYLDYKYCNIEFPQSTKPDVTSINQ